MFCSLLLAGCDFWTNLFRRLTDPYYGSCSISGKVYFSPSTPASGINVQAFISEGGTYMEVLEVNTDSQGNYTVSHIIEGEYRLTVNDLGDNQSNGYYRQDSDDTEAGIIELTENKQVATDINFVLPPLIETINPADGATTTTNPTFSWKTYSEADYYVISMTDNPTDPYCYNCEIFSNSTSSATVQWTDVSSGQELIKGTKYYWDVKAKKWYSIEGGGMQGKTLTGSINGANSFHSFTVQ